MELFTKEIVYKQTRLKVITDKSELIDDLFKELVKIRKTLEEYIFSHKEFGDSLIPLKVKEDAPSIVKEMANSSEKYGLGPMACVAGMIAELLSRKLQEMGANVAVVENGGDVYAITNQDIRIGIYSKGTIGGDSLAFDVTKKDSPLAICSSSGVMGHSKSFGECELATVVAKFGCDADAGATFLANKIKSANDVQVALENTMKKGSINGAIVIHKGKIGIIGDLPRITKGQTKEINKKVTRHPLSNF